MIFMLWKHWKKRNIFPRLESVIKIWTIVWRKKEHVTIDECSAHKVFDDASATRNTKKEIAKILFRIYGFLSVCMSKTHQPKPTQSVLFREYLWHGFTAHRSHMLVYCNKNRWYFGLKYAFHNSWLLNCVWFVQILHYIHLTTR